MARRGRGGMEQDRRIAGCEGVSLAESLETLKRLEATQELSQVIDSRIVRRYKPSEQIGEPPSFKSRWCVRGDQEPDACELQAYSPTACTQNLQVILQLAASHRMPGSCETLAGISNLHLCKVTRFRGQLASFTPGSLKVGCPEWFQGKS